MTTYSKMLFASMELRQDSWNLTSTSPLWKITHPALLKLKTEYDSGLIPGPKSQSHNFYFLTYLNSLEAQAKHPHLKAQKAFPWAVGQFLKQLPKEALFDFSDLGCVFLTDTPIKQENAPGLNQAQITAFLDYALSSELWGPSGKWIRFHATLNTLFEKNGLLISSDFPGHYILSSASRNLEKFGFYGEAQEEQMVWTLPWDFPLSAVRKLEWALTQE